MNEKDMIERYIYEVTKRVPQKMRDEIRMELEGLIEDMCANENCSVEEALQKLGNPAEFAKRYRGDSNYVIGPEYYDNYIWLIKIAAFGIGISAIVSAIMQGIVNTESWSGLFSNFFIEFFNILINGTISMVGILTIIFAILEHQKIKLDIKPKEKWSVDELSKNVASVKSWTPASLPPIPDKRAVISRGDSIASIIFITIFAVLLLCAPQLFGAFEYNDDKLQSIACIFNLDAWDGIAPILIFCLLVALVDEVIRLVSGYYCKPVMYSNIICNALQIVGSAFLLKCMPLFNPNFVAYIQQYKGITEFSDGDILRFWGSSTFTDYILLFICVIALLEMGVTIYKTLRYSS